MDVEHSRFLKALNRVLQALDQAKKFRSSAKEPKMPLWAKTIDMYFDDNRRYEWDWLDFMYATVAAEYGIDWIRLNSTYPMWDVLRLYSRNVVTNSYQYGD